VEDTAEAPEEPQVLINPHPRKILEDRADHIIREHHVPR